MRRTRGTAVDRRPAGRGPLLAVALALLAVTVACSDSTVSGTAVVDTGSTSVTGAGSGSTGSAATAPAGTMGPTATTIGGTTSSEAVTTPATVPTTAAGLPGSPFNSGPGVGTPLAVVGVRYDDVLNFRTLPDPTAPIVATVPPLATAPPVVSAGQGRLLDRSAWWLVTVDGRPAWANKAFLGALGTPTDVLAPLTAALGGADATDLDALIAAIGKAEGSQDPLSTVVVAARPSGGAATVDVMGLGDDAVAGQRYAVTTTPRPGGGVRLATATRTDICGRGVAGGLCV